MTLQRQPVAGPSHDRARSHRLHNTSIRNYLHATVSVPGHHGLSSTDAEAGAVDVSVSLNKEQARVYGLVVDARENVFFTGAAGTQYSSLTG